MKIKVKQIGKWYEPTEPKLRRIFGLLFKGHQVRAEQILGLKELGFEVEYEPTQDNQ